jgi:hypothetical protein
LRGNKRGDIPSLACWVDTETDQKKINPTTVKHVLKQGMACFQRARDTVHWCAPEWFRFTTVKRFWDLVEERARNHTKFYIFAHNAGFDACVLDAFNELPKRGWSLSTAVVESPPVILTWRKDGKCIRFLDTLNWWRTSLEELGKSVDLQKLPMPVESASVEKWNEYNRRDVEIIHRAIHAWWVFLKKYDLGAFSPTLASQAFRAFRHRFMEYNVLIDNDQRASKLARDSLHGGRTECFRLGWFEGPIITLDINSMYPAVMRDNVFPAVLRSVVKHPTKREMARWAKSYCVTALVDIRTKRPRFAYVQDHYLMFPVGRFTTTLTTVDLKDALAHDEILSCYEMALYEPAPLFQSFVDTIYSLRLEARKAGNDVQVWLLKILMNSLYGKFAQRGSNWEECGKAESSDIKVWKEIDAETREVYDYRQFGGIVQLRSRETESLDSHPAIASHVTAYARALLWNLIQKAGQRNVLYCDTDSLWVNQQGCENLADEINLDSLGKLKIEGTHDWVVLNGPKDYSTPTKQKIKGVKKKGERICYDVYEQDQWSSLSGMIRTGSLDAPTTSRVIKTLKREYKKGRVLSDGRVLPFVIGRSG